jgi:hypothetical protein
MKKKKSKSKKKIAKVFREFGEGQLHSGSKNGPVVTNRKQATAIALSEERKKGTKISKKSSSKDKGSVYISTNG